MTFTINIENRAKHQQLLLKSMPTVSYVLTGSKATISGIYIEEKRVHDSYRYIIKIESGTPTLTCFQDGIGKFNDQPTTKVTHQVIALIIESLHKDEYDLKFKPIAPAQGPTGEKIKKYICNVLIKHRNLDLEDGIYDLIICNSVQFQASLYNLHNTPLSSKNSSVAAIRDKAWLAIYKKEKGNFLKRLEVYNPVAVINACTSKLKPLISSELIQWKVTKDLDLFIANSHPCIWSLSTTLNKHNRVVAVER